MRTIWYSVLVLGLGLTGSVQADDAAARALVDKGIQALGGEAKLAKFPAVTAKLKGTFHGLGQAMAFTGDVAQHGPDRQRFAIDLDMDGQKFRLVGVLNGDKGWLKFGDDTEELDKDELAQAQDDAYSDWVATLLPLKDKAYTLAPLGESKVEKRPALGVKVSHKGRRAISLYFDKETGLLVKSARRVVDDDTGQEVTEESFYSDYKEAQGIKYASKVVVQRDGKPYLEGETTEYQPAEKLDESLFAKP